MTDSLKILCVFLLLDTKLSVPVSLNMELFCTLNSPATDFEMDYWQEGSIPKRIQEEEFTAKTN
jgi:hypothetical protein